MAAVKRHPVLHYSVIYICWSLLIIEPIRGILKNYVKVSDVTLLAETKSTETKRQERKKKDKYERRKKISLSGYEWNEMSRFDYLYKRQKTPNTMLQLYRL